MTAQTALYWTCSALGWVTLLIKLHDLRDDPRNPMRQTVCVTLFLAATAVFCAAPATITHVNRISGVPNLAAPLVYSLLLALSASSLALITYWRESPAHARRIVRRWVFAYALLIVALNVLFLLGEPSQERRVDFDTHYADAPYLRSFILLYLLALAVAMTRLIRVGVRWARVVGRPWLRRGLRLIAAGSLGALLFSAAKLVAVAARLAGTDWDVLSSQIAPVFATLGLVLSAAGYALPAWGDRLTEARGRVTRYRAYRDLYPLWDAMRRAVPAIVPPIRVPWWDLELRLTRRLAEINDGRLALRAHIDPRVGEAARELAVRAGLSGTRLRAVVDASQLRSAVAAKAADIDFTESESPAPGAGPHEGPDAGSYGLRGGVPDAPAGALGEAPDTLAAGRSSGGSDGVGELAWLVRVSRDFARSPLVAEAVASGTAVAAERRGRPNQPVQPERRGAR
ncbi:MAB_1171c family putative transporter [Streptomyces oceani]|uniref:MAB_1171c family putative transporter n=1 Tax=Streptomyces oceani TaxID=1075402 RepID=UPI0008728E94|nr:MAB_1171c family putative transporter [Streptomyces oceani]